MQRYNSFNLIHKGLRAMMYDTALNLQQTYFADTNETEVVLEKLEAVLYLFGQHVNHENTFILPVVEALAPRLVAEFQKEHITDTLLGSRLKNLLNIYRNVNFMEEKLAVGSAINKAFIEFMVFNLEHMAKEEILLNQALWEHYTDQQLIALNQKLLSAISQEEKALSSLWILRGINSSDAITWLKCIRQTAPAVAFNSLLDLAEKELTAQKLKKVQGGLTDGLMVA